MSLMKRLKIDIQSISDKVGSGLDLRLENPIELLSYEKPSYLKIIIIQGSFHLENVEKGILVKGQIVAEIEQECDRCTKVFSRNEPLRIEEVFFFSHKLFKEESDDFYQIEDNIVNLEEYINQQLRLNFPIKVLCRTDCQGLCPKCGVDLNVEECDCQDEEIDPRMNKLKEWFEKERE